MGLTVGTASLTLAGCMSLLDSAGRQHIWGHAAGSTGQHSDSHVLRSQQPVLQHAAFTHHRLCCTHNSLCLEDAATTNSD